MDKLGITGNTERVSQKVDGTTVAIETKVAQSYHYLLVKIAGLLATAIASAVTSPDPKASLNAIADTIWVNHLKGNR